MKQHANMPRHKDNTPAIRVYTVCDESRYVIVRNVPALGCGDDLLKLFASHGDVEECKPMDAEDCEEFTDVYWIKFRLVSNARFAKRKLDEYVFMGNRLQVTYAPEFENVSDTMDKLEGRRKEVLARLNPGKLKNPKVYKPSAASEDSMVAASLQTDFTSLQNNSMQQWNTRESLHNFQIKPPLTRVSSDEDYFPSQSMNQTVKLVREKLNKIQQSTENHQADPAAKKRRVDNRRRI